MRSPIKPDQVNKVFTDKEWLEHQPVHKPTEDVTKKMRTKILLEISEINLQEFKVRQIKARLGTYAAAAVLIIATTVTLLFTNSPKEIRKSSPRITVAKTEPIDAWNEIQNTIGEIQKVRLPDSSIVKLYPNGTLRYKVAFSKTLRDVHLTGKAYFKVKKDHKRPFNVYAGGLKTTALGTSFTINTTSYKQKISVKLHTGKIVVAPMDQSSRQIPVFLDQPGSALLYNTQSMKASILKKTKADKITPERLLERKGSTLTIKNIQLERVFDTLGEAYQVKIITSDKKLSRITFTGTVDLEMESIEQILQTICLINNLTVTRGASQEYVLEFTD